MMQRYDTTYKAAVGASLKGRMRRRTSSTRWCLLMCRFLGRRNADAIHVLGSRRPRSAKARNRGVWGSDGAAGAMGIWPRR